MVLKLLPQLQFLLKLIQQGFLASQGFQQILQLLRSHRQLALLIPVILEFQQILFLDLLLFLLFHLKLVLLLLQLDRQTPLQGLHQFLPQNLLKLLLLLQMLQALLLVLQQSQRKFPEQGFLQLLPEAGDHPI